MGCVAVAVDYPARPILALYPVPVIELRYPPLDRLICYDQVTVVEPVPGTVWTLDDGTEVTQDSGDPIDL